MKIKRRTLIGSIAGFLLASTSGIVMSLTQKKYLTLDRKRTSPFFMGWYDWIESIDTPKQVYPNGINLLIPYLSVDTKYNPTSLNKVAIRAYLDNAHKIGAKVLLEIYKPLVELENISGVKEFIRTYKNHPAVYAWYLYDEPEVKKPTPLSPQLLERVYQAIKEEDRSRPVALVFADNRNIEPYLKAMDILMWDWYPCHEGDPEFYWVSNYRKDLYKVLALANLNKKKFYNVLQGSSYKPLKLSLPTKAEIRYMFYLSIVSGADGLLFYTYYFSTPAWNQSVLYPMIKEFKPYIPAIIGGKDLSSALQLSSGDVDAKLFSIPYSKKYVAIVVNHGQSATNLTVKFDRRLAGKKVITNRAKVAQLANQSGFTTVLKPYEVVVCEIG
jgi:Glycosyl hydrolases family 2, TIM barrel domain